MSPEEVKGRLLGIHRRLRGLRDEEVLEGPQEVVEAFEELERLADEPIGPDVLEGLGEDPDLRGPLEAISRWRSLYCLWGEVKVAEALLHAPDPWAYLEGFPLFENYRVLVETEGGAVGLEGGDLVVMLGAGPLPLSLILHRRLFGARGIGIEKDPRWTALAGRVIERLGMADGIAVLRGDERLIPALRDYKLLIVAALAGPKERVFQAIGRCLPEGALVSHRIYEKGLRALIHGPAVRMPPALEEVRRIRARPPVKNALVLIKRAVDFKADRRDDWVRWPREDGVIHVLNSETERGGST